MSRLGMVAGLLCPWASACDRFAAPEPPAVALAATPSAPEERPCVASQENEADDEAILVATLWVHAECLRKFASEGAEARVESLVRSAGLDPAAFDRKRRRISDHPLLSKVITVGVRHCPPDAVADVPTAGVLEPIAPESANDRSDDDDLKSRVLDFMVTVACSPAISGDPKALDALLEERGFTAETFATAAQAAQADPGFGAALVKRVGQCAPVAPPPAEAPPLVAPVAPPPVEMPSPEAPVATPPVELEPPPVQPEPERELPSPGGCRHDQDCKGERVCVERRCVFP